MKPFELNFFASGTGYMVSAEAGVSTAEPLALSAEDVLTLAASGEQLYRGHLQEEKAGVEIGRVLFEKIFREGVRDLFAKASESARKQGTPLRIVLRFPPASEIQEIPWELLHDGQRFLALDSQTPVVRHIRMQDFEGDLGVEPPLRVLVTAADPAGVDGPAAEERRRLQIQEEADAIQSALAKAGKSVRVDVALGGTPNRHLTSPRLQNLFQRARALGRPYHVWHHAGHGRLRSGPDSHEFFLILETESGNPDPVPAEQVSQWVAGGHDLKLAVINLCFSGSSVGLSTLLARLNVPAVIGFRAAVADPAAKRFAESLYGTLPGMPLDQSLTWARHTMAERKWPLEWALPVLFSRSRGRLDLLVESREKTKSHRTPATRVSFGGDTIRANQYIRIGVAKGGGGYEPGHDVEVNFNPATVEVDKLLDVGSLSISESSLEEFQQRFRSLQATLRREESSSGRETEP